MPTKNRISYEPFLFALAVIGIVYKMYQSVGEGKVRYDWTLGVTIGVFVMACGLWLFNTKRNREPSKLVTKIEVGNVTDARVLGVDAAKNRDQIDVGVKTGDVQ